MESQDHFIDIYTRICKIKINMLILLDLIIIKHNFIILYFNFLTNKWFFFETNNKKIKNKFILLLIN